MARKRKIVQNVEVISIADKGLCIGKNPESQVFLVEKAVPGDYIDLAVRRKKKGLPFGAPGRFIRLSPHRTEARCEYFGDCGGCKWQNLKYRVQLEQKENMVRDAITRIGRQKDVLIEPILASEHLYEYRNKLEYSFSSKRWISSRLIASSAGAELPKENALGFHAPGVFNKVVDIETCHLQTEPTNKIKNLIRTYALEHKLSFYDYKLQKGFLRGLIVRIAGTGQVMVTMVFGAPKPDEIRDMMHYITEELPEITTTAYIVNTKSNDSYFDLDYRVFSGPGYIIETLGALKYKIGPKSFFQTNTAQAKRLYDTIVEYAELNPGDVVYDLYTGVGSIALYIARQAHKVVGIENVASAIVDARNNADLNEIKNVSFVTGDVKEVLQSGFREKYGPANVVITDPPRAGMHPETVESLLKLLPERIVYVSCNPATQARDIKYLSEKYDTVKLRPVDMFPHTSHVECVALLRLRK